MDKPIGREVSDVAKDLSRAFSAELAQAAGSLPVWLTLLALKQEPRRTQQELAAAVGIEGATLTHHLDRMEKAGLIDRTPGAAERRAVRVEMTPAGDELFLKLAKAAQSFDARLRDGLSGKKLDEFRAVLRRLRTNVVA